VRRAAPTVAALAVLAAAALGCGGEERTAPAAVTPSSTLSGADLRNATCTEWNRAGRAERRAAAAGLGLYFGKQTPQGRATKLDDERAVQIFDQACANPRARAFALWKVYAYAAPFDRFVSRAKGT